MSTKPNNTPRSPSYAAVASKGTAEEQGARVKQQTKSEPSVRCLDAITNSPRILGLSPVKLYLVVYNLVSALLWANLLFLTIHSVITHPVPSVTPSSNVISRYLFSQSALVPGPVSNFLAKLQGSYHHGHLGWWTKWTQSLAVLEVVHASLGWVRSPLGTTAAQVYSRLWTVWGVVESNKEVGPLPGCFLTGRQVDAVSRPTRVPSSRQCSSHGHSPKSFDTRTTSAPSLGSAPRSWTN
jgi:hypothetical protein